MVTLFVSLIMSLSLSINKENLLVGLLIAEAVMSIITLLAYKIDKQKAKSGKWRTKEKTLLILPCPFFITCPGRIYLQMVR